MMISPLNLKPGDRAGRPPASTDLDLLVCGSRSYGPLGAVMFGSVSQPLLHRAASPLLVIPRGRERRLESLLEN
jgi:hypothetical protein